MEPGTTYVQKLPSGKVGFVRRPIKIKPTKSILADAFLPNRDGPAWTPPYTCNLDPPPTDTIDLKDTNRPLPLMDGPSQSYHHCRECQLAARKYDPVVSSLGHLRYTLGFMLLQRQRQDIGVPYVDGIARLHTNIDIRSYQARYLPLVCVVSVDLPTLLVVTAPKAMIQTGDLEGESVVEGGVAVRDSVLIRSLPFNPLRPLKYYFKLLLKPSPLLTYSISALTLRAYVRFAVGGTPTITAFHLPRVVLTVALPRAAIIYLIIRRQAVLAACIVTITAVAIVNPGLTLFGGQGALMSLRLFHQRAPEDQLSMRIYRLLDKLIDLTLKILTRGQGLQMRIGLTATNA
ncbi:hypothetical protein MaudMau93_000102 [Microsporum audouinii]